VAHYRAEGASGLSDRSSRHHHLYRATPLSLVERIEALRRQRFTGARIARGQAFSPTTVSRVLQRA
jgi:hypothetical protein